jgi:hypothetical protein
VNGGITSEITEGNDNALKACNEAIAKSHLSTTSLNGYSTILDLHGSRIRSCKYAIVPYDAFGRRVSTKPTRIVKYRINATELYITPVATQSFMLGY